MALSGTVAANKDTAPLGYRSLLLATFQFTDGTYLRLSTNPLNVAEGGYQYGGNNYLARLAEQDITVVQARSEAGIDRIPAVSLHLVDADRYLWTNYEQAKGFKGAIITLSLILVDISDSDGSFVYSSDAPTKFSGICDAPTLDASGATMVVSATSSRNMSKVYLPIVNIQQRCPWIFPSTAAQRLDGATNPASQNWECGYNPDQSGTDPELGTSCQRGNLNSGSPYTTCGYTKADCQARGMFDVDSSARKTGRFGGMQWAPRDRETRTKSYTEGKTVTAFNARNDSIYTDRAPMLYGTQWIEPPIVVNELGDGNSTRMECVLCMGDIGTSGVLQVVVNGVIVPQNGAGSDPLFRWNFIGNPLGSHTGSRNGSPTKDAGYNDGSGNPQGDPYGSYATIEIVVYRQLAESGSVPQVRVLAHGPSVWQYAKIASVTSGVATLTTTNRSCAGNSPFTVQITGNSNGALNAYWGLTNWTPSTITLSGTSASGTGGYVRWKASTESNNPVWVLLDILTWAGWQFSQIDVDSFLAAAEICDASVTYTDLTGNSATHARFIADIVLHQRRTAAEVIQQLLTSFRAQLVPNSDTGLLQLFIRQTLADSQPSAITGSNYSTAVKSITASGSTANGYVAYLIDESVILRPGPDAAPSIRVYSDTSANTPNRVAFNFQDADNSYAQDSISVVDIDGVLRAGGYQAGQENVETMPVVGISNFDQGARICNAYLSERLRGNEAGDTRGTRYFEIPLTVRLEHLRVGHIVLLRYAPLGLQPATQLQSPSGTPVTGILARVIAIKPSTDYEAGSLTLAWHEDTWYTDAYGQQAAPLASQAGKGRPNRPPRPWKPYGQQPITGDAAYSSSDWGFSAAVSYESAKDGSQIGKLTIGGCAPVADCSPVQPPLMGYQGSTAATGGSIPGNQSYVFYAVGIDSAGKPTAPSRPMLVQVPNGTNTNTITTPSIDWDSGTVGYVLFGGVDDNHLCAQASGASSPPATITIAALNVATYGPPDLLFSALTFYVKRVSNPGVWKAACSAVGTNTITFAGAGLSVNEWGGRIISRIGQPGTGAIDIADFVVSSNTADTLTVTPDPAALGYAAGDMWAMATAPTAADDTSFTDSKYVNAFAAGGLTASAYKGSRVRIIAGTGRGQVRTISANTTTKITVTSPWDTTPDSTSLIIIEEAAWQDAPDIERAVATTLNPSPAPAVAVLNIDNYNGQTVIVQAMTADADGKEGMEAQAPIRLAYIYGSGGAPSLAPDVVSITAAASLVSRGTASFWQASGVITVNDTDPNWSFTKKIRVVAVGPDSYTATDAHITAADLSSPFSVVSHQISYTTGVLPVGSVAQGWRLYAIVSNDNGVVTTQDPSAPYASVTVTPPDGPLTGGTVTVTGSVVLSERSSSRYIDASQLTHVGLNIAVTVSANLGNQFATVWFSQDNGTTYRWLNWYSYSGSSFTIAVGHQYDPNDPGPLVPNSAAAYWVVKVAPGAFGSTAAIPSSAVTSNTLTMNPLGSPSAGAISSLSVSGPTYKGVDGIGGPTWELSVTGTLPATLDPNTWTYIFTVQGCNAAGTADPGPSTNAGEREWFQVVNFGQTLGPYPLVGGYNATGSAYTYLKLRCYAVSRASTVVPGYLDPTSVLVTGWSGGLGYKLVNFGANPGNTLDLSSSNPSTAGTGIVAGGGVNLQVASPNITSILWDWDFELTAAGAFGGASKWGSQGNAVCVVDSTAKSGTHYARLTGASALIAQTVRVGAGLAMYMDAAVRSNNVGGTHSVSVKISFYDNSGSLIGSPFSNTVSGYVPAWFQLSQLVTSPAGAVQAVVHVTTPAGENASGYWDVDNVMLYQPPVMTANGQTNDLGQQSSAGAYTLARASSTSDASYGEYGKTAFQLINSSGQSAYASVNGNPAIAVSANANSSGCTVSANSTQAAFEATHDSSKSAQLGANSTGGFVAIDGATGDSCTITYLKVGGVLTGTMVFKGGILMSHT